MIAKNMLAGQQQENKKVAPQSAQMRDSYHRTLQRPTLSDQEIDEMRQRVIELAHTLCEHVWGKQFY